MPRQAASQKVVEQKPPAQRSARAVRGQPRRPRSDTAREDTAELVDEIWTHLVQTVVLRRTQLASRAADFEVTLPQVHLLKLIAESGQPCTMSSLAKLLDCDASNITGLVDRLEARGLVLRGRNHRDRRITIITLTEAGHALLGQLAENCIEPPASLRQLKRSELAAVHRMVLRAFPLGHTSSEHSGRRPRKRVRAARTKR